MTASMDDLTAHVAEQMAARRSLSCQVEARHAVAAIQAYLRERGVLLGPDGLIQAERQPFVRNIFGQPVRSHDPEDPPLYTLAPVDPRDDQ